MVFIFLRENLASGKRKSRDQFCSKMNEDFKNNFYFKKKQWRTLFFTKNIHREVRAGATGNHEKKLFIEKKCVSICTYYLPKLKKESVVVSKIFGKNRFFFFILTPLISEIKTFKLERRP